MDVTSVALSFAVALMIAPQAPFAGRIDPAPVPGPNAVRAIMFKAAPDLSAEVQGFVPEGTSLYGSLVTALGAYRPWFVMAEFSDGRHTIFSDFSGDGVIDSTERLEFSPGDSRTQTAHFVVPGWHYASYPVTFSDPGDLPYRRPLAPNVPPARGVLVSNEVAVRGRVKVDGREVLFLLGVDPKTGRPTATSGRQFMDTDGDGTFDTDYRSPETVWARGAAAMFRVGTSYLSLASMDLARGSVAFTSHAAKDYARFELRTGEILPDFAFVDFDGRPHRLSEYRGKVVLIDFWGTWCGPCVGQIPFLKSAYEQFHADGLEIIGMDSEHPNATPADLAAGVAKAREFTEERGIRWPQARESSIKGLTANSFMVETWPTTVLLDREGRIVSVDRTDLGQPSLRGDALAKTLASLLVK